MRKAAILPRPSPHRTTAALICWLAAATAPARATPQSIDPPATEPAVTNASAALPKLRAPWEQSRPLLAAAPGYAPPITSLGQHASPLPPPRPLPQAPTPQAVVTAPDADAADAEAALLQKAMLAEVSGATRPNHRTAADAATRAAAMLRLTSQTIATPQLVIVVDRNPDVEKLLLMMARPGSPTGWRAIATARISTGQSGRKDYFITPIGVFAHTDAILDFRALGTYNEHHVRGLGTAGMRVWDFGWQWAQKGWLNDGEAGDIRLQMHATDPDLLERRLGHPASEGCVRLSSTLNRFLDHHGVLDADYRQAAVTDVRYSALLPADATPSPFAGRLLIVIDTRLPAEFPPTAASRPANMPAPGPVNPTQAPGTDTDAPIQ